MEHFCLARSFIDSWKKSIASRVSLKSGAFNNRCLKSVQIRCFSGPYFPVSRLSDLLRKSPYKVQIQEDTDQKKLRIWTPYSAVNCVTKGVAQKVFYKNVLKNFAKITGKYLHRRIFFNKVASLQFYQERNSRFNFSDDFCNIFTRQLFIEHLSTCEWQLWVLANWRRILAIHNKLYH